MNENKKTKALVEEIENEFPNIYDRINYGLYVLVMMRMERFTMMNLNQISMKMILTKFKLSTMAMQFQFFQTL